LSVIAKPKRQVFGNGCLQSDGPAIALAQSFGTVFMFGVLQIAVFINFSRTIQPQVCLNAQGANGIGILDRVG